MASNYETFGKYVLLEKLATGGMAEVYLAKAPSVGGISKFVAIKRILPQFSENPDFIDMFKDEAKIAINLSHSNIVSIYEFGVERKQFFLVMDYVEGRNLRQILNKLKKTSQQLTTEQILYIVKEVASGLDNAHRCLDGSTGRPLNITHRDMSPQNVMISFEGEVRIVDFGIAKAESQLETTRAGTLKGKFGYMSPEQAEGLTVDLRTDVFSLGIVLWELLANDRLFVANNEINTLRKIRDCQIPSLRKINPNIPQELDRIVNKALARDRNLRYQTSAAFQKDLNKFLNRQYPDFSPHDFSVFIKTLFANEILENRKRLVEYAKIPFPSRRDESTDTGEFTNTVTETGSMSSSMAPDSRKIQAPQNFVDSSAARVTFDSLKVNRREIVQKSIELKQTNEKPLTTETDSDSAVRNGSYNSMGGFTNSGLGHSLANAVPTGSGLIPSKSMHTPVPVDINQTKSNFTPVSGLHTMSRKKSGGGKFLALLAVGIAGIYFLQPSLFNNLLGLIPEGALNFYSKGDNPVQENFVEENHGKPEAEGTTFSLLVTSKPVSGADIYINGKKTGRITPSVVPVPRNTPFSLDVQMLGYETFSSRYEAARNGQRVEANLKKEVVGYIDITVSPPSSHTIIYVNGEKLSQGPPIRNLKVQAGERITIKAINPYSQAEAEQLIVIDRNQTKKISLRLRGGQRVPSARNRRKPSK